MYMGDILTILRCKRGEQAVSKAKKNEGTTNIPKVSNITAIVAPILRTDITLSSFSYTQLSFLLSRSYDLLTLVIVNIFIQSPQRWAFLWRNTMMLSKQFKTSRCVAYVGIVMG